MLLLDSSRSGHQLVYTVFHAATCFVMTNKLSRDSIRDGDVYRMLKEQEHVTNIRPLTTAEREAALDRFLENAPDGPVWVLGYGSLIWNPAFHFTARANARIWGYHRSFCIRTPLGRGSPDNPGLVLALDAGGCPVGTGRLLPDGHIRRIAVVREWRCRGVGSAILQWLVARAREQGCHAAHLHAQTHALGFYASHGFIAHGEVFTEAGILHRAMSLSW